MTAATLSWAAGLAIGVFLGVVGTMVSAVLLLPKTEAEPTPDPTPLEDLRVGDEVVVVTPVVEGVVADFDFSGDVFLDAWDGSSRWVSAKDQVFRVKPVDHEPYDWSEKGL